ncbi:MAG: helix-turn-helix transcriptional regulator [Thermomicrobiales bacterium]
MEYLSDHSDVRRAASPLLVGRSREQVFLREELANAVNGHGRLVLLGGEAGIGKTMLTRYLSGEAERNNAIVLTGHCYDLMNTPPFGPWLNLVAGYRGQAEPPPNAFAGGQMEGTVTDQGALFAEMLEFFTNLVAGQPLLVVLEDMHWSDPASLELLRYVTTRITHLRLLLVVTYRVDELTRHHPLYQQLPALIREAEGYRLDLHPLEPHDIRALVAAQVSLPAADEARLVNYLDVHAEGNPFYTTELLRALQEANLIQSEHDSWMLCELDHLVMPPLLRQVIDGRVGRLGEETRKSLAIAAVIGQEVPLDLWGDIGELDDEALLEIVERAIEYHLMESQGDGRHVRFVHALTREALYQWVAAPRRRIWHRLAAEALAARPNADPDVVAYHYQQAGDSRAPEWLILAGDRAQRAYAWLTARERLSTAADILTESPGQEALRAKLLFRCGRLRRYSDPAQGVMDLFVAERLADLAGDHYLAIEARLARGLLHCYADEFGLGQAELVEATAALEALPAEQMRTGGMTGAWLADAMPQQELVNEIDLTPTIKLLSTTGVHHRRASLPWFLASGGRLTEAIWIGESLNAQFASAPLQGGLLLGAAGHTNHGLGIAYASIGRPDDAREAHAQAREIYGALDHHAVIAFSLLGELRDITLTYFSTDIVQRRRLATEAEAALVRAGGALLPGVSPRLARLARLFVEGGWDEIHQILGASQAPGNAYLSREITATLGQLARYQGDPELAWAQVQLILPAGSNTEPGERMLQEALLLQRLASDLSLDKGDFENARDWLRAHDRWLDWSSAVLGQAEGKLAWARHDVTTGDMDNAWKHAEESLALASTPRQPLVLLGAHRLLGQLAADRRDTPLAEAHLTSALTLADACAAPFERALTLLVLSEHRSRSDHAIEAASLMEQVQWIATSLHARSLLTEAAARMAGIAPSDDGSFASGLTPREVEVLRLVAKGLTDAAVGQRLFISSRTVSQHLRSIYAKLDLPSRAAATRYAVEHRLT